MWMVPSTAALFDVLMLRCDRINQRDRIMSATARTTLSLEPKAFRIARERAELRKISLGKAVSELIEEADRHRPKMRVETDERGFQVLVSPEGSPQITSEMVKELLDNEW